MSAGFVAASNVLVIAGKGGVGKTTVGVAAAIAAARDGCDVLLIELDGQSRVAPLFGLDTLTYDEITLPMDIPLSGSIRARQLVADTALADYLQRAGLKPLTDRLSRTGALEVVSTAAPGIRDLLALGKIRQLEQAGAADLIVVDGPASGHALTLLSAPAGLADSTTSGPVRDQADQVLELFADERRCQVALVTLPEETPVSETIEAAFTLEEQVGIKLAPVVVNGCWPPIDGLAEALARTRRSRSSAAALDAARFRLRRMEAQAAEIARLGAELPLPQVHLPQLFRTRLTPDDLGVLADHLVDVATVSP
jgi:anion-transporting  ArsA/GET3 family ATPase